MSTRDRSEHESEFARIVAFTDGVLAIAITLLVLNLDVPELPDSELSELPARLLDLWPQLLAYALSFAVVGRFWLIHHRFFGGLARFDDRLMNFNLLYLALLVLVPFTTEVLGTYGDQSISVAAYASVLGAAALVNWTMIRHALRHDMVKPESRAATETFGGVPALAIPGIFLLSVPIGFLSPGAAQLLWIVVFLARYGIGRRRSD